MNGSLVKWWSRCTSMAIDVAPLDSDFVHPCGNDCAHSDVQRSPVFIHACCYLRPGKTLNSSTRRGSVVTRALSLILPSWEDVKLIH